VIQLTNDGLADEDTWTEYPHWSPDGTKIVFISGIPPKHDIYVINAEGSEFTNLTNNPTVYDDLSWSPDGKMLAYMGYSSGHANIYVMNFDGSRILNLTESEFDYNYPAWSP
jgi:Tol biopolymer transport system component